MERDHQLQSHNDELCLVAASTHSATFEIRNGHAAISPEPNHLLLNDREVAVSNHNVISAHGLASDRVYTATLQSNGSRHVLQFKTAAEICRLNIRDFGAVGNGIVDDTAAIQAAICSCPAGGVVEMPPGRWLSGPLFLGSNMDLHIARDARLIGHPDVERWPILPAVAPARVLGSWEGEPSPMHAALINGIRVRNVRICGEGIVDANASFATWWRKDRRNAVAARPRTIYLVQAEGVTVLGLCLQNSPSWTVHALGCRELVFADLRIRAPADSPNTDGINPESCERVRISGVRISTGDDCIAIKSGRRTPTWTDVGPTRDVVISNSIMESGHGAVAVGSEMSGGVFDVVVTDCIFNGTERGLRIKTCRGRGGAIRNIALRNVRMCDVGTPFVVNCFYWCGPGGKSPLVGDRRPRAIDECTPELRDIWIADVRCDNVKHCAAFVLALPERKLQGLKIERYRVRYDPTALAGYPDKAAGIDSVARAGIHVENVRDLVLDDIDIAGADGPALVRENVD
jgi:polygalacturonase